MDGARPVIRCGLNRSRARAEPRPEGPGGTQGGHRQGVLIE